MNPEHSHTPRAEVLKAMLQHHGVPVNEWNVFKGLTDLLREIQEGETILRFEDGTVVREVKVARIYVYYIDDKGSRWQLIETKQTRNDGITRQRELNYVAEKMKASENPAAAALRGIREELGIHTAHLQFLETSQARTESPSYPGLTSNYNFHVFELWLDQQDYSPQGYTEEDGKKTTYFEWRLY